MSCGVVESVPESVATVFVQSQPSPEHCLTTRNHCASSVPVKVSLFPSVSTMSPRLLSVVHANMCTLPSLSGNVVAFRTRLREVSKGQPSVNANEMKLTTETLRGVQFVCLSLCSLWEMSLWQTQQHSHTPHQPPRRAITLVQRSNVSEGCELIGHKQCGLSYNFWATLPSSRTNLLRMCDDGWV